jgi:hypothetical protein
VHQPRPEPLQELPLGEHDLGLVAEAPRQVVEALCGLAEPDEIDQQLGPAREQRAADRESGGERERSGRDPYGERAFPSSTVMAARITPSAPFSAPP